MKKIILFISLVTLTSVHAQLYVATTGSDTNPCTSTSPCRTINHGLSKLLSGGTLTVRAGTYHESPYISGKTGSASLHTRIVASGTVILYGPGVNTGRVKIINCRYLDFTGFTITNYNQGLFVDSSNHIGITNVTVHDVGQEAMHVRLSSSFVTFTGCHVHDTRKWQYNGEGFYIGTGGGTMTDATHDVVIQNCTIYNTTDEGIELKTGTYNNTVKGNTLYRVNTDATRVGAGTGAIEIGPSYGLNGNHKVFNNKISQCQTGVRLITGGQISGNTISTSFYGVLIGSTGDNYIRYIWSNQITAPIPIQVNAGIVAYHAP